MIMATNMDISYRQGIRSKGFAITAATGITQQTLSLSGLAKSFEGFLLSSAFTATPQTIIDPAQLRITLTINNDTCIDDDLAVSYALTATGGFTGGFPFFIPDSAPFDWSRHDPASHHKYCCKPERKCY
jgi:hypothetical protein